MSGERTAERCVACGADLRLSCDQVHPEADCYHLDGHRRPEPTWRDVIRAARAAGLSRRTDWAGDFQRCHLDANGGLDAARGWVTAWRTGDGHLMVDLVSPKRDNLRREVTLDDPTPAEILAAARLVGLGGDSDA